MDSEWLLDPDALRREVVRRAVDKAIDQLAEDYAGHIKGAVQNEASDAVTAHARLLWEDIKRRREEEVASRAQGTDPPPVPTR